MNNLSPTEQDLSILTCLTGSETRRLVEEEYLVIILG